MSEGFAWRLPFGAEIIGAGRVRFRIWAPACKTAAVIINEHRSEVLLAEGAGWFSAEVASVPGDTYHYRFDDHLRVPDIASRAQRGGVDGVSQVIDPRAYHWRHPDWCGRPWRETVIYELHVGVCGGYTGVQQQLARLRELGVTAIELMPVGEFPGAHNWGYDGVLPFAPSASYGSPDDLKALIDTAHGHGLMVFLDVVYNHFGPQGNYLPEYAKIFFRDDLQTPWGCAIDFRRPEVREYFIMNALYWLHEYRFDGLRLDAVHAIIPHDWLNDLAARVRASVNSRRQVHIVVENDENSVRLLEHGIDAQWNDDFHHVAHVLLTGETEGYYGDYAAAPARDLGRCLAEGFVYQGDYSAFRRTARGEPSKRLALTAFVAFLQNHDQVGNRAFGERLSMLVAPAALHAATALLLLSPQIPLLWMGQEWGSRQPFLYFTDYQPPLADAVRDGRRREFAGFAAFRDELARSRIPDPNDANTFKSSIPDFWAAGYGEGASESARCRELLAIRQRELMPYLDSARSVGAQALGVAASMARWRLVTERVLAIWVNFAATPIAVDGRVDGELLYATCAGGLEKLRAGTLMPHSLVALRQSGNDGV
ncbi:MAG TPA: malto-oligosyltrehalose trehalohydrolase [Gammaproteobacteria bacterium]|nr:malto-oligosyltrehalose trehalohydrolase [Gammaproteobacteria bacterium]